MKDFPHHYAVTAELGTEGWVRLASGGLPAIDSAPPVEFDGPGDRWSPETLLVAAVADCFVLSFRAIARNSAFSWTALRCQGEGILDRAEGGARFTEIRLRAELTAPAGADPERARRLLEKADRACLVSRSLRAPVHLESQVQIG